MGPGVRVVLPSSLLVLALMEQQQRAASGHGASRTEQSKGIKRAVLGADVGTAMTRVHLLGAG